MARLSALLIVVAAVTCASQKLRGSKDQDRHSSCKGSFCDGVPDDRFAILVEKVGTPIEIGASEHNHEKCVNHNVTSPIQCDADAGNLGNRLNEDDHTDTFEITVKGSQVCARRSDKNEGWAQVLKISCKELSSSPGEKCMCLTSPEGDCSCKGCSESEQQVTCTELLGPCECMRSEEAVCDCNGYCHTRDHRADACINEPGCSWTGQWCEAQLGLLWD